MTFQYIKRKLYNLTHPVVGEVWMLHRVVEKRSNKAAQRELEVTPEWLEQQIMDRRTKGWRFVSIAEAEKAIREDEYRSPFISLTFDDGYRDNYTIAYPLLKRLDTPFAVYISTDFLDNRSEMWWYPDQQLAMSTEELLSLDADPLCTIGAHTVSHPKLDTLPREHQLHEIKDAKESLENLLGHSVHHFSFPHGAYNSDTLAICRQLHFSTIAKSWGGHLRRGEHPYVLPRVNKKQND